MTLQKAVFDFRDRFQAVRMVVVPLVLALPWTFVWCFIYAYGFYSAEKADEPIINAILPFIGTCHIFIAGFMFVRETKDIREMKQAIQCQDEPGSKERFLVIAQDRIPKPLKYVIGVTGVLIQLWTMELYYRSFWVGFASVTSVAYVLALIWEVIADFDDPIHGVWVIKNIPKEWIEEARLEPRRTDMVIEWFFERLAKLLGQPKNIQP